MIKPSRARCHNSSSWWATSWLVRWMGLGEKRYFNEVDSARDVVRLILLYRQRLHEGCRG